MKKSLEPRWNQTFMYSPVHRREFRERMLELTVWDQARVREEESQFLGEVRTARGQRLKRSVDVVSDGLFSAPSGPDRAGIGSAGRPASLVQAAAPRRFLSPAAQRLPVPAEERPAGRVVAEQQEAPE